jgi:exopolyphosphatase/guanosine-5'-triphosphate,3'-diphosphate pyrophosphatase
MPRLAAIDIGSNSIRLLAAEVDQQGVVHTLAADRRVVRLGSGVFREGRLGAAEITLGCQVLTEMAETCRKWEVQSIRAVATAAMRDATNSDEFIQPGSRILGAPIEVISGLEEARLIHLGVQSNWPHPRERLLILDIGGGSAELILAEKGHFVEAFSKPLGAIRLTELFLKSDPPDPRELVRLQKYIKERIAGPATRFNSAKANRLIATSATAAAAVSAINLVARSRRDLADRMPATAAQIRNLLKQVGALSVAKRAKIPGIGAKRAEIIVAGVAVLHEVIQALKMPRLYYSTAGVREGIIADLSHGKTGQAQAKLTADQKRVVRAMAQRYGAVKEHTRKVGDLSVMLFHELRSLHGLPSGCGRLLEAAANLYNIGHFVNEAKHHRHSMYLVANSDLPGFEDREREVIANLCRYHRKSMPQATHETFQALHPDDRRAVLLLTPLLRLAAALDESREQRVDRVQAVVRESSVELRLYSTADVDIEQWHAQRVAEVFQQAYGLPLAVKVKR